MRLSSITLFLLLGLSWIYPTPVLAQGDDPAPLPAHCGEVGPLPLDDDTFCGCTWGAVYYRGQPVAGGLVTLQFGTQTMQKPVTLHRGSSEPIYSASGEPLGAQRGDVMTLTVTYAGQTNTRSFRALPDADGAADGEQEIALAFLDKGAWSPWLTAGYTNTVAVADDQTVWAGGTAGLISIDDKGVSKTHILPWSEAAVRAVVVAPNGHVWAAGTNSLVEYDGNQWRLHTLPLSGALDGLAVNSDSSEVWISVVTASTSSVLAYTGSWHPVHTFDGWVRAIVVDDEGHTWVATDNDGVYRQDGSGGWDHFLAADGLATNGVRVAAAGADAVWFGHKPVLSSEGVFGGISRYDLSAGIWQVYSTTHGLPADLTFASAPAPIYALSVDEHGVPWAGTVDGIRFLPDGDTWLPYTAPTDLRSAHVTALAARASHVYATVAPGLDRLDRNAVPGAPPTAQIATAITPEIEHSANFTFVLNGAGTDGDESGGTVVAWDWQSDVNGPLCSSPTCTLEGNLLTVGQHTISLRVQDDEGVWSEPVSQTVTVMERHWAYLPLTRSSDVGR